MTSFVSIELYVATHTEKAIGFCHPDAESEAEGLDEGMWIAKKLIRNHDDLPDYTQSENNPITIEIPTWLAEQKEIEGWCEELEDEVR